MTASCAPHVLAGNDLWFGDAFDQLQAVAICQTCPIAASCLSGAVERGEVWGTWGGRSFDPAADFALIEPTAASVRPTVKGLAPHGTHARYQTCTEGDDGRACRDCLAANARHAAEWRENRAVTGGAMVDEDQPEDQFEQLNMLEMTA